MEDAAKWKDKVDLVLDSRQVFLLLFGGAALACLVFILGIMVGKRLENRNTEQASHCGADLEKLDRMIEENPELTFQKVLVKKGINPNLPPEVHEMAHFGEPGRNPSVRVETQTEKTQRSSANRAEKKTTSTTIAKANHRDEKDPSTSNKKSKKNEDTALTGQKRFTLQVSSFKERTQAEAMVKRLEAKGLTPYMISSHIPRRGMWYRVRLGAFESWNDAVGAKKDFENNWKMTAYVMKKN
jgi:DedD protein